MAAVALLMGLVHDWLAAAAAAAATPVLPPLSK